MKSVRTLKPLLVYTMTSGLGDFIVLSDLIRKIESVCEGARCLIVHRGNPHIDLWKYDDPGKRFFDMYNPSGVLKFLAAVNESGVRKHTVFGIQMAPGSWQGYFFFLFLKKIGILDYIVDFNLINADIITPPRGTYILDIHLNQVADIFQQKIPSQYYHLRLPFEHDATVRESSNVRCIGVHPWSRRGRYPSFAWSYDKWSEVIKSLLRDQKHEIVVFGKDRRFDEFRNYLRKMMADRISFEANDSVHSLVKTIQRLDLLVTVNTSAVHIGYALGKKMVVLSGPSLDLWTPKGDCIRIASDEDASFLGADKPTSDERFRTVQRIDVANVLDNIRALS